MAYIAAAGFRLSTIAEYCADIPLTSVEAQDAVLDAAIVRMSERIDEATGDHFEATTAATLEIDGPENSSTLYLPRRTRAVTTVKTRDADAVLTTEPVTVYRFVSSLNAAGTDLSPESLYDRIEIIPTKTVANGRALWPTASRSVQVVGDFDWAACPADIKRATALLVYDHFKPATENLRRAKQWTAGTAVYDRADSQPFGIPEADAIVAAYKRPEAPTV